MWGFLNSRALVKVKCFPGSQASMSKRQFTCKSASEGAIQFCVQAVVHCDRNLHQHTAFTLKSFAFADLVSLCTADWKYWDNRGPSLCSSLCFFCSRRKYISGYGFTTFNRHIFDQPFRKRPLTETAITTMKNTEGGLLLICLWLLWNASVLKQFSALPQ